MTGCWTLDLVDAELEDTMNTIEYMRILHRLPTFLSVPEELRQS